MTELLASYALKTKRLKEKSRDNKSPIPKSPIPKRKGRQRLLKAKMFSQFKIRSRGTWEHILMFLNASLVARSQEFVKEWYRTLGRLERDFCEMG